MELLSRVPGLVVLKGRRPLSRRQVRSRRSIVAGLIWQSWVSTSADIVVSSCLLRTLINSGKNGCSRFEHKRSVASRANRSASTKAAPYFRGRPRFLLALGLFVRCSRRIADLRWYPVTLVNSSRILPFSFFGARRYHSRIASVYSRMLLCVMLPPFGNSFSEATIPSSVTKIISQFVMLTECVFMV
jgi:hypothetical protein